MQDTAKLCWLTLCQVPAVFLCEASERHCDTEDALRGASVKVHEQLRGESGTGAPLPGLLHQVGGVRRPYEVLCGFPGI